MLSGLSASASLRMRASDAARNRAPKSLNAAVGPWNSSSTDSLPASATGTSGAGKSKASRTMSPISGATGSPATNGCEEDLGDFRRGFWLAVERRQRNARPGFGHVQAAVGREALRERLAETDGGRTESARADELHATQPGRTCAPAVVMGTTQ